MDRATLIVVSCCLGSCGFAAERLVPNEYATIQKAIDAAQDGDVVIVRPGTYYESINFRSKAITVRASDLSSWAAVQRTIISGHYAKSSCVTFDHGETSMSVLEGFSLWSSWEGGLVQSKNGSFQAGGGILCVNSSPTIRRCRIVGNNATYGGGIALFGACQARILNCLISGNGATLLGGAILIRKQVTPPARVPVNTPRWREGGLIVPPLEESTSTTGPVIVNCTITNSYVHGSAHIYRYDVDCGDTRPTLLNTIIYGPNASLLISDASLISYCCIRETHLFRGSYENSRTAADLTAQHNIVDIFPGFLDLTPTTWSDEDSNAYHLETTSPCVNAGSPGSLGHGPTDIDGQPRVMAGRIDVGADEVKPELTVTSPSTGDVWAAGSTRDICWNSLLYEGAVSLSFSRNGGHTWDSMEYEIPNEGRYAWHVPDATDANECVLLISPSNGDPNVTLTAGGPFTIHPSPFRAPVEQPWPSPGGDAGHSGLSSCQGPDPARIKWRFELGGAPVGSVTVGFQGRVHVACEDGRLHTLDPNGKLLWTYAADSALLSSPTMGPDGSLYIGAENGKVHAVDISGRLLWTSSIGGAVYSSPAVATNGNVYVGSTDGAMHALSKDGRELWRFQTKGPGVRPRGEVFASPTMGRDGSVYAVGLYDPNLYALDPDRGRPRWVCRLDRPGKHEVRIFAAPVVAKDGTIYQVLVHDAHLYAIEPKGGTILWATDLTDRGSTGPDVQSAKLSGDGWSEPVLGPDGTIYVSTDDPYLRAIDSNGHLKWMTRLGDVVACTLTVDKRGFVYAASEDGFVHVVGPDGVAKTRFTVGGLPAFPVLTADDSLVVTDSRDYSLLITDAHNTVWAISSQHEENGL